MFYATFLFRWIFACLHIYIIIDITIFVYVFLYIYVYIYILHKVHLFFTIDNIKSAKSSLICPSLHPSAKKNQQLQDFNFDPLGLSVKCEKYLPWFREALVSIVFFVLGPCFFVDSRSEEMP